MVLCRSTHAVIISKRLRSLSFSPPFSVVCGSYAGERDKSTLLSLKGDQTHAAEKTVTGDPLVRVAYFLPALIHSHPSLQTGQYSLPHPLLPLQLSHCFITDLEGFKTRMLRQEQEIEGKEQEVEGQEENVEWQEQDVGTHQCWCPWCRWSWEHRHPLTVACM